MTRAFITIAFFSLVIFTSCKKGMNDKKRTSVSEVKILSSNNRLLEITGEGFGEKLSAVKVSKRDKLVPVREITNNRLVIELDDREVPGDTIKVQFNIDGTQFDVQLVLMVSTFAGTPKSAGYQNGPGSSAKFSWTIAKMVFDPNGNLLVCDAGNNCIRKITPGGVVSTFAGSTTEGSQDGSLAQATFRHPIALAYDSKGNLFVGDAGNGKIRKITPGGTVSTYAGSGKPGDPVGPSGSVWLVDITDVAVDKFDRVYILQSGAFKKITEYSLLRLVSGVADIGGSGMAMDSAGNFLIVHKYDGCIRKVTPQGVISNYCGICGDQGKGYGPCSANSFWHLNDIAINSQGDAYVTDYDIDVVKKVRTSDKQILPVAGTWGQIFKNGEASQATFFNINGIVIAPNGAIYITDQLSETVRKIFWAVIPA